MSPDNGRIVAVRDKDSSVNKRGFHREASVEVPFHMRNRFLHETSHLPAKVFRHLESYIPPTSPPKKKTLIHKPVRSHTPSAATPTSSVNMDLGPDLYAEAEILEANQHDPQRESSSAAASRAKSTAKYSSSPNSSSRYSSDLVQSPATDSDDSGPTREPFVYKSNPTTAVCRLHEFSYSSQYTRPATELLQEILEVRYPLERGGEDEESALLGGARSRSSSRERSDGWWQRLTAALWSR
ncbi:hypothetical protein PRZ48_004111 [Zasmidium cellare]|uniref:Uncharacterized protein n=1 Tax=Zasmidium cellare TaxID=395010 RepID=A0ABR0EWY4_ZASCE|nr:hypothetical protein PRZ48_004111 [Zasmidium cellare]